nr:uncharacterized protein LOC105850125 [Hydra vulgaris]
MFGDMSPSGRTKEQSSIDRGIGLTSTPMRKRSSPSKKASSSSRSPVFGGRSPVMCKGLSPAAKGIGLTFPPKEARNSPCVRVEADAEFDMWCNGTLGSSNRHRKKASDMSQTEINQHMLNFTYVVMDALDIKSVLPE